MSVFDVKDKFVGLVRRVVDRVLYEPAVVVGVVVAALNAATVQSWQGYASAVGVALLRFVVSPDGARLPRVKRDQPPVRGAGFDRPADR